MKAGSLISCFFQDSHSCCCQRGAVRVRGKYVIKKRKRKNSKDRWTRAANSCKYLRNYREKKSFIYTHSLCLVSERYIEASMGVLYVGPSLLSPSLQRNRTMSNTLLMSLEWNPGDRTGCMKCRTHREHLLANAGREIHLDNAQKNTEQSFHKCY